jgi:hypothetical protein
MGNGHGNSLFNLVVKNALGCARSSSHGAVSGSSAPGTFFSSFFSSFLLALDDDDDWEEEDEVAGPPAGRSATIWFHMMKNLECYEYFSWREGLYGRGSGGKEVNVLT